MKAIFLETPRLFLKTLHEENASLLLRYVLENRSFLEEWVPKMPEAFFTLEGQLAQINHRAENSFVVYLFKKENSEQIIGQIGLSNIVLGAFQSCNIGVSMLATEINNGYMAEAVEAVKAYAFEVIGLHRIEANIMPRNHASKRLFEKLGFVHEGLSRKYLKINDRWEDHERYVIWNE
jgi:ribosomal-protein-alanine N-acetyltransferase